MKKIIAFLLSFVLCLSSLCGCALEEKPVTLADSMEIPEDGIIAAEIFETLKAENKVITFSGKSGGVSYEWTVFGSDIKEPQDENLKVTVTEDSENKMVFSLCTEKEFSFVPVLSLCSANVWNADNALVYRQGEDRAFCSASVTGNKTAVLNFSVTEIGSFSILAENASNPEEPEQESLSAEAESQPSPVSAEESPEKSETEPKTVKSDPYLSDSKNTGGKTVSGKTTETDPYLSASESTPGKKLSDGKQTGKDPYLTDPVPEGKPLPVEPEEQKISNEKTYTCTFSIECSTILNNLSDLNPDKLDAVPKDGVILLKTKVTFYDGESVFDVLQRVCEENGIHMEASWTPMYNSAYVEGIHNLYEFDCGSGSGWMYRVNGWYPNYGCSRYQLTDGDVVEWRYTCDLGDDIGGGYAVGG